MEEQYVHILWRKELLPKELRSHRYQHTKAKTGMA